MLLKIAEGLRKNAEAKGLAFEIKTPMDHSCVAIADCEQLTHAFKNLIDNSIKYTLSGGVYVTLASTAEHITLIVKDTGVGITDEDKQRLFTEGGKGKNSQKVNVESTGYGLYITKKIITTHNGKIWAESEGEGKGSTFHVEIPKKI
jgi:signal transduction histidine kinase